MSVMNYLDMPPYSVTPCLPSSLRYKLHYPLLGPLKEKEGGGREKEREKEKEEEWKEKKREKGWGEGGRKERVIGRTKGRKGRGIGRKGRERD